MDRQPLKISDLDMKDTQKAILSYMMQPRTIAEVAAKFDKSYSYISQSMSVMRAKGWLVRCQGMNGVRKWRINTKELIA